MKANTRRWAGHAVHLGTHGTIVTLACLFPSAWLIIFAVLDAYYVPRMWVNTEERYLLTLEVEKRCGTLDDLKGVDWGVQEHLDAIRAKQSGRFGVGHE